MPLNEKNAIYYMILISISWGTSYVLAKLLLDTLGTYSILFLINCVGVTALGIVVVLSKRSLKINLPLVTALSFLNLLNAIFGIKGTVLTSSSKVAFIIQLSVIITPVLTAIANRKPPSRGGIGVSMLALFGLAVMTLNFSDLRQINSGDLLIVASSFCFSMYLVILGKFSSRVDGVTLIFYQFLISFIVYSVLCWKVEGLNTLDFTGYTIGFYLPLAIYLAISVTVVILQVYVVRFIHPNKMAVFFCLEPICTVVIAFFVLSEVMTFQSAIGGTLILIAVVLANKKTHA